MSAQSSEGVNFSISVPPFVSGNKYTSSALPVQSDSFTEKSESLLQRNKCDRDSTVPSL